MKHLITLFCCVMVMGLNAWATIVKVTVNGLDSEDSAIVSISSETYIDAEIITGSCIVTFDNVPEGVHAIEVEASGYAPEPAVLLSIGENVHSSVTLTLVKQAISDEEWRFSWHDDDSQAGYTVSSYINKPEEIEFLGKKIVPSDISYTTTLLEKYNIVIVDEELPWSTEYAYRLVETLRTLPVVGDRKLAKFVMTEATLYNDIEVVEGTDGAEVRLSKDAFVYANPFLVNIDGIRGRFFSKRLHHALVNYVTSFGQDVEAVDYILKERFGCSIRNIDYEKLTRSTTHESANSFQDFMPEELVDIINMYEEEPEGFHKISNLKYLVRRHNGHDHPIDKNALAVAYPTLTDGYIEFMERAFLASTYSETLRTIIHEKSHFMWETLFSDQIKQEWIEIGGWYENPMVSSGWSTTKDVEFVSQYAHQKNPNEDMAESIAFYINDPEKLRSRSLPKYEFIRDRIMHGVRYISKIPDHLSFEVLNLNPDYDYPGRVRAIDILVEGKPDEDKLVTFNIDITDLASVNDGASVCHIKVESPSYLDSETFQKVNNGFWVAGNSTADDRHHFTFSTSLSRLSKRGKWRITEFSLSDELGNQRFESEVDVNAYFYINNVDEDIVKPHYEKGSLHYVLSDTVVEGHKAQMLEVLAKIWDNKSGISSILANLSMGERKYSSTLDNGRWNPADSIAQIELLIPEYYPSGEYYMNLLGIQDVAGNSNSVNFYENASSQGYGHDAVKIRIDTSDPDYDAPEIDLDRIIVYSEPIHKEAPDGETKVTIHFYARDNISGFRTTRWVLRDPQGIEHYDWFYNHRNFYSTYFDGDPKAWERYTIDIVLPAGSAPGIWGLAELSPYDKADNFRNYNFVETLIFEPGANFEDYELFAEVIDNHLLKLDVMNAQGVVSAYSYRIINETNGLEISGSSDKNVGASARSASICRSDSMTEEVDISSIGAGDLIIIATIFASDESIIAVRTKRVTVSSGIMEPNIKPYEIVKVYDIAGRIVKEGIEFSMWRDGLPAGFYIVGGQKYVIR